MKKLATLFIVLMLIAPILIGCTTNTDTPNTNLDNNNFPDDGVTDRPNTGTNEVFELDTQSIVKLLLAEERLNTTLLKNQGNVFDKGVEVMNTLATKAMESIDNIDNYTTTTSTVTTLNTSNKLSSASIHNASDEQVIFDNAYGGGKVTFDGENYLFSDFIEVSNSYDSFSSTAKYIAMMADDAAKLIDGIKKNVRIVDKWVLIAYGM